MNKLPEPFYQDAFITLFCGDVRKIGPLLPAEVVQCVVTSPPYYNLRNYNVQGQLGLETTPVAYVRTMVRVFAKLQRTMRKGASLYLNMGDSYWGSGKGLNQDGTHSSVNSPTDKQFTNKGSLKTKVSKYPDNCGLKDKDLMGMPWRLAFGLQKFGWWLRSEIIWFKKNPMPESVEDRPTKAHEQIFLLANAAKYFYDAEAIKERAGENTHPRRAMLDQSKAVGGWAYGADDHAAIAHAQPKAKGKKFGEHGVGVRNNTSFMDGISDNILATRNARSVWDIPTKPYPEAHFATFPPEIPERCIKAGTSEYGQCAKCGKPWNRIVEKARDISSWKGSEFDVGKTAIHQLGRAQKNRDRSFDWSRNGKEDSGSTLDGEIPQTTTVGWRQTCKCFDVDGGEVPQVEPQVVLDPFAGGRHYPDRR